MATHSRIFAWNGLPFPSPGNLTHPRMEPVSPALGGGFFTTDPRKAEAPILWSPDVKSPRILTLILGKTEGKRRRGWQRMRWLESITDSMDVNLSKLQEVVEDRGAWRAAVSGFAKSWA